MGAAFQPKPADDLPYRQPSNVLDPYRDGGRSALITIFCFQVPTLCSEDSRKTRSLWHHT
eukprot:3386835-Amphidinium_carterae.1